MSVQEVYNKIATEFDKTRSTWLKAKVKTVAIWPNVRTFLDQLPVGSSVVDIGCGNGKNMLYRNDLYFKGIDISEELVKICQEKGLDVIQSSMTSLPYSDNVFNNSICIASYHHLDNDTDREASLKEMYRCLKPGGKILITVWAMEQDSSSKRSFTKRDEHVSWKLKDGSVHYRYYHIYNKGDLEEEIVRLEPRFKQVEVGYEAGNWWIVLEK